MGMLSNPVALSKTVQARSNRSPGSLTSAAPARSWGSHSFCSWGRRAPAGFPPFSVGAALPGGSQRPAQAPDSQASRCYHLEPPAGVCNRRRLQASVLSLELELAGVVPMPRPGSRISWAVEFLPGIPESPHPCRAFQGLCIPPGVEAMGVSASP